MNQKPQCPRGHGNLTPIKTWILKAKGGRIQKERQRRPKETGTKVTAWRCTHKQSNGQECGYSHRTFDKLEE